MWSSQLLLCLLLGGAVLADHHQQQGEEQSYAWKSGSEYKYRVQGRTLAALHKVADQYTGMLMKAELIVQPKSANTLRAQVSQAQFAQVHAELPGGWESHVPEHMLNFENLPISRKPFEIKLKNGAIDDLVVEQNIPLWEVNVLKSIVSQLQVDAQGENLISSEDNHKSEGDQPFAAYKTMEDSITGKCEVHYDITPLHEFALQVNPELAPVPQLHGGGQMIDVIKSKNFSHCHQLSTHYDGFSGLSHDQPGLNNENIVSRSSLSRVILSGTLDRHTIQSSVTTNKVIMSPSLHQEQNGMVVSRLNLTLAEVKSASNSISSPSNPKSTGNLVYRYPTDSNEDEDDDDNSSCSDSSSDSSSSSESDSDSDSSSDSSSSSSSSSSSEEEQNRKRHRRSAPQRNRYSRRLAESSEWNGQYERSSHEQSSDAGLAQECQKIASQIGNEVQDPNTMPERKTLEKFDSLVRLIRAMDAKEIDQAQQGLYQPADKTNPNSQSDSSRRSAWAAYRDAVAASGTEQALQNIKQWIQQGKIQGIEAAEIVASQAQVNKIPSAKYMGIFYSIATLPEVNRQAYLNSSAILALTDLAYSAQVNNATDPKRYPVHGVAGLSSKDHSAAAREYIPYLAKQLQSAVRNADSPKILVYIRALGNLGHPQILSVLEPYLEGEKKVSDFQRLAMVMAMDKLGHLYPKLAQSVLFKIYRNTGETSEVRTAAVYQLMQTNPPPKMLQRMAHLTNWDSNKQVNSAVKTAILDAAAIEDDDQQELANNAREAVKFLSPQSHGIEYSQSHSKYYSVEDMDLGYKLYTLLIGSDDSNFPKGIHVSMLNFYGKTSGLLSEIGGMVSSIDQLASIITGQVKSNNGDKNQNKRSNEGHGKWSPEKIAKLLKIQSDSSNQLEGQLVWSNEEAKQFFAFDNHTIDQIPNAIRKAAQALKNGQSFNTTKFSDLKMSWSFPTEMGFPFVFDMNRPSLFKIGGEAKAQSNPDLAAGSSDEWSIPSTVNASADVHIVYSDKLQVRMGFITPFDHHEYMAGVINNLHVNIPLRICLDLDFENQNVRVKLHPIQENRNHKLIHYSIEPFTAKVDRQIYDPTPLDKNMQLISTGIQTENEMSFGERTTGMVFRLKALSEGHPEKNLRAYIKQQLGHQDVISIFAFPWAQPKIKGLSYDLILDSARSSTHAAVFTVSQDSQRYAEGEDSANGASQEHHEKIRKQAVEGIDAADIIFAHFAVDFVEDSSPRDVEEANRKARYEIMGVCADSESDSLSRCMFRYHQKSTDQETYEVCLRAEIRMPNIPELNLIEALNANSTSTVELEAFFGEQCENGAVSVQVQAEWKQSPEMKNYLRQDPLAKQCAKQMEQGNFALPACRSMIVRASQSDEASITIKHKNLPFAATAMTASAYSLAESAGVPVYTNNSEEQDDERMDIFVKFSNNLENADIFIKAPDMQLAVTALETRWFEQLNSLDYQGAPTCVLDRNAANTFDNHTYSVELGNCWHVVFTTVPQEDPDNYKKDLDIPEDMHVTVIARDINENEKVVQITLGDDEIIFSPSQGKVQVQVNGNEIQVSEDKSYTRMNDEDNEAIYDIYGLSDGSVKLSSDEFGIDAVYDGSRVKISADGKYRGSSRGLCGTLNGQPADDWTTPQNCVVKNPEEFAASYIIKDQQCEGPAKQRAQNAQQSQCTSKRNWFVDVISDAEAGRQKSGKGSWGGKSNKKSQGSSEGNCYTHQTKVIRENGQTCFSLRPVPDCNSKCRSVDKKMKNVEFHCIANGETASKLYKSIRSGSSPDFSRKHASKTMKMAIPTSCAA